MENEAEVVLLTRDDFRDIGTEKTPLEFIDINYMKMNYVSATFKCSLVLVVEGKRAKILKNRNFNKLGMVEDVREFLIEIGVLEVVK